MDAENVEISEVTGVDDRLVAAFDQMIPQLSNASPPPDAAALQVVVVGAGHGAELTGPTSTGFANGLLFTKVICSRVTFAEK